MLGRIFKALREFRISLPLDEPLYDMHEGLQVDLPACTSLESAGYSMDYLHFILSCSNVQILRWPQHPSQNFDLIGGVQSIT